MESERSSIMTQEKIEIIKDHLSYIGHINEVFFLFLEDFSHTSSLLHIASIFKNNQGIKVIDFSQFYSILSQSHSGKSNCIVFIFNLSNSTDRKEGLLLLEYYSLYSTGNNNSKLTVISSYKRGICDFVQMIQNEGINTSNIIFAYLTNLELVLNNIESLYKYLLNFYTEVYHYSKIWMVKLKVDYNEGKVFEINDNNNQTEVKAEKIKTTTDYCVTYHLSFIDQIDLFMHNNIVALINSNSSNCYNCIKKIVSCCKEKRIKEIVDTLEVPRDFLNKNIKELDMTIRKDNEESLLASFSSNLCDRNDCAMIKIPIENNPIYLSFKLMREERENEYVVNKDNKKNGSKRIKQHSQKIQIFTYENINEINSFNNKNKIYKGQEPIIIHFKNQFQQVNNLNHLIVHSVELITYILK